MENSNKSLKKKMYSSITGTVFIGICCFTPLLVIAFGILGLSIFTPYLDYVLFPSLGIMIIVSLLAYRKWKNNDKICSITKNNNTMNDQKIQNNLYTCPMCGLKYKDEEWSKKCESWCTEHKSCNLDITKYAESDSQETLK